MVVYRWILVLVIKFIVKIILDGTLTISEYHDRPRLLAISVYSNLVYLIMKTRIPNWAANEIEKFRRTDSNHQFNAIFFENLGIK